MREILERLPILAQTDSVVLITGETGTGKDKLAETIHKRSARSAKPFIKINCGALPEALLESELFGYVKGAFTGAVKDKQGMFRLAQGGTLFLTEIGDMPLQLQVKLLSVLDDQEFFPLGSEKKVKVDVRIMAATNLPLRQQVAKGLFREDLFYRLNVLHLHLPPLRERETDTRFLISHFLKVFAERIGSGIKAFNGEAMQVLIEYDYPGNIRELRNIVEYCFNICQGREIGVEHLPSYLLSKLAGAEIVGEPALAGVVVSETGKQNAQTWLTIERDLIIEAMRDRKSVV
jgi:transcriptional regulator with PAS, ATPase and Fis domain